MDNKELVLTNNDYKELLARFKWDEQREVCALLLARGKTRAEAARQVGIGEATVYRWLNHPEFSQEVDKLCIITDFATSARRVRLAKQFIRQQIRTDDKGNEIVDSKKDILDWLKFIRDELEPHDYKAFIFATFGPPIQKAVDDNIIDAEDVTEIE